MRLEIPTLSSVNSMLNKCTREAANPSVNCATIKIQNQESIGICFYFEITQFLPSCFSFKFSTRFSKNVLFKMEMQLVAPWKLIQSEKCSSWPNKCSFYPHLWFAASILNSVWDVYMCSPACFWVLRWNLTLLCHCTAAACWGFFFWSGWVVATVCPILCRLWKSAAWQSCQD